MTSRVNPPTRGKFEHPLAFWLGVLACSTGVILHLPMYFGARQMHYVMSGMRPDATMITGMVLIGLGLAAVTYGVLPARGGGDLQLSIRRIRVAPADDAPIRGQHIALLVVLAVAITIDVMKPATLSFVVPGVAREYGLKSPANPHGHIPVSWLPLMGIGGTVLGSWVWGSLGDRIGRRSAILLAGILFVTTSICGAMPGFSWNLLMCFLMGIGVGGMLPIAFALMAETIPARHRGWLMVLVGGDIAGAYVATSWLAEWLTATYSWRILWLIGLPTGLLFIALNRWIPESPRYLIVRGRDDEARAIMTRFGADVREVPIEAGTSDQSSYQGFRRLFQPPFAGTTLAIMVLAVGTGLVTFGFQLWIPTNLQHLGFSAVNSAYVIRNAALLGLPFTVLVAAAYGWWGSRKTIVALSVAAALTLSGFVVAGNSLAHHRLALSLLLVIPLSAISSVAAVVSAYAAEVYPTMLRSRGSGLAAGMAKLGGVVIIAVVVAATTVPSMAMTALIGAVPLLLAAILFLWIGPETKHRPLEEITGELGATTP
ncbi:MFS transporter [Jatrophihabitans lederbergiae]|uniref:MFS transporter n=1 Tax=Jatrophihabitans lederbergiae TaxID=3075547 RepID=A0ABU2JES0_9ACTN|nr:MFS transporter [Jatrophihabitans sp. DSM 44399]MDT0263241.1 MFS transporter [Jatrophihabitans sp. DSM 44399]